ncbi:MAG: hypothetical protein WC700_14915, partial [Gemmatimonadaceae bacterium]
MAQQFNRGDVVRFVESKTKTPWNLGDYGIVLGKVARATADVGADRYGVELTGHRYAVASTNQIVACGAVVVAPALLHHAAISAGWVKVRRLRHPHGRAQVRAADPGGFSFELQPEGKIRQFISRGTLQGEWRLDRMPFSDPVFARIHAAAIAAAEVPEPVPEPVPVVVRALDAFYSEFHVCSIGLVNAIVGGAIAWPGDWHSRLAPVMEMEPMARRAALDEATPGTSEFLRKAWIDDGDRMWSWRARDAAAIDEAFVTHIDAREQQTAEPVPDPVPENLMSAIQFGALVRVDAATVGKWCRKGMPHIEEKHHGLKKYKINPGVANIWVTQYREEHPPVDRTASSVNARRARASEYFDKCSPTEWARKNHTIAREFHVSDVFIRETRKRAKIVRKAAGEVWVTVRTHRVQRSPQAPQAPEVQREVRSMSAFKSGDVVRFCANPRGHDNIMRGSYGVVCASWQQQNESFYRVAVELGDFCRVQVSSSVLESTGINTLPSLFYGVPVLNDWVAVIARDQSKHEGPTAKIKSYDERAYLCETPKRKYFMQAGSLIAAWRRNINPLQLVAEQIREFEAREEAERVADAARVAEAKRVAEAERAEAGARELARIAEEERMAKEIAAQEAERIAQAAEAAEAEARANAEAQKAHDWLAAKRAAIVH